MQARVTKLRRSGMRVTEARSEPKLEGHLILSDVPGPYATRRLALHGPKQGAFDGSLIDAIFEPQIAHVSATTIVIRGYESAGSSSNRNAGYVQEWMVEFSWPSAYTLQMGRATDPPRGSSSDTGPAGPVG